MASAAELSILLNAKDAASGPIGNVNRALGSLGTAADAPTSKFRGLAGGIASFVTGAGLAVFGAGQLVQGIGGLASSLFSGNVAFENTRAQLMAFTKDGALAEQILADIRTEAAKTPFAFQELANATAGLIPSAKMAGVSLMDLVRDAEVLAASNPAEGLEGAAFALREAVSGDFTSVIERFNLPRSYINKLKEEGVPALEIVRRAMGEMGYDMDLVSNLSMTASGRWSTFMDTLSNIKTTVMQGIFTALSDELANLQGWLDKNQDKISGFAELIGRGLAAATRFGIDGIKALVDLLKGPLTYAFVLIRDGIKTFAQALQGNWSDDSKIRPLHRILGMLGTVIREHVIPFAKEMYGFFRDRILPVFMAMVGFVQKVVDGFGEGGLGGALKGAIEGAKEFASAYWNYLGGLAGIGEKILEWISPYIPVVLEFVQDMLGRARDWLMGDGLELFGEAMQGLAASLWGWVSENVGPLLEQLGELLTRARDWLIEEGIPLFKEAFSQYTGPVLETIGELFVKLLVWIRDEGLPLLVEGAAALGKALYEWVMPALVPLLAALGDLLLQLGSWIVNTAAPAIGEKLAEWGSRFWTWVSPQILPLLDELAILLGRLGDWIITTALPTVISKLAEWGWAFISWVGPKILPLLDELWKLLSSLGGWITGTALPEIVAKLTEWGTAFLEWVEKDALPFIAEKLDALSAKILAWVIDTALPKIKEKLGEWGAAFLDWIKDEVLPYLAGKMDEIMTAIGDWVSDNIETAKSKMVEIGTAILNGIANGIRSGASSIVGSAIDYVTGLLPGWVKKGLGIESPSKVMIPVGEMVSAGIAQGLTEGADKYIRPALAAIADFVAGYPIPLPHPGQPNYGGYNGQPGITDPNWLANGNLPGTYYGQPGTNAGGGPGPGGGGMVPVDGGGGGPDPGIDPKPGPPGGGPVFGDGGGGGPDPTKPKPAPPVGGGGPVDGIGNKPSPHPPTTTLPGEIGGGVSTDPIPPYSTLLPNAPSTSRGALPSKSGAGIQSIVDQAVAIAAASVATAAVVAATVTAADPTRTYNGGKWTGMGGGDYIPGSQQAYDYAAKHGGVVLSGSGLVGYKRDTNADDWGGDVYLDGEKVGRRMGRRTMRRKFSRPKLGAC